MKLHTATELIGLTAWQTAAGWDMVDKETAKEAWDYRHNPDGNIHAIEFERTVENVLLALQMLGIWNFEEQL